MFVNDIFKKKQLDEGGPFSSTEPKKPRKGSVADLAAQKRREQEKGKQPVEPRDHMVGVARVKKDIEETSDYFRRREREEAIISGKKPARKKQPAQTSDYARRREQEKKQGVAEGLNEFAPSSGGGGRWYSDDQLYEIIGEDWLEAFDVSGDQGNIDLRGERARLFLAQEAEAWLTDRGYRVNVLDVKDDGDELSWYIQGPLYRGLAEGSGVTKLNDYNQWLDKVDAQGAQKHMQKNRTLIVAQSWDGEKVGEFDTSSNQGWVMTQGVAEDFDNIEQIKAKIQELEAEQEENEYGSFAYDSVDAELQFLYGKLDKIKKQGLAEGSAQDKLYKRHQELRKKSGLPDPDYYKELKASYDLPDQDRYAKQKEIKQKYKVTNEDREQYIEELGRAGYEIVTEKRMTCPECGGAAYEDKMLAEKQDACYHKVKSRYKVWPSAYASGALVRCRKKGAKNWGNKSK